MNYLDQEQKQKMEKIFNLQNSIEASKEKQEERITSYDNYLNTNMKNKTEELKMKKLLIQKKQRDKKKKLEKKMNDWVHQQEEQNKELERNQENENKQSEKDTEEENENEDNNNNDYNELFDVSKYNVVSMENINKDNKEEKEDKNIEENKEAICIICQRKFASFEKLKIHEKLSELHRQNLEKLKLNNNNN